MAPSQRILVFDVETTGTDKRKDQVIELCVQFGVEVDAPSYTWRIRPTAEMCPGAQAVHGISMADLEGAPGFGPPSGGGKHRRPSCSRQAKKIAQTIATTAIASATSAIKM